MRGFFTRKDEPYFLIYQMGKVGSTAIASGLQQQFGDARVKHTHDHAEARQIIQGCKDGGQPVIVITGFREPLGRCISAYFENVANATNRYWYVGAKDEVLNKSCDWLIGDFKSKAPMHVAEIVAPWLSRFKDATGLSSSDFKKGGSFWKASAPGLSCYAYKLENISDFLRDISQEAPWKNLASASANVGESKWSGDLYRAFKSGFGITRAEYQSLYGGIDYVEWLYDAPELRRLTDKFVLD